jgi:hypothetical protein
MRLARLIATFALVATGCGTDTPDAPADPASGEATAAAAAPEATDDSSADCLIGTWQIDPASMDLEKIPALQELPDAEFSVGGSTGRALLAFEASGDAVQTFEDFSITIDASVMGQTVSVRNNYSGTARATYAVEDERIVMEPGEADLSASVNVNGGTAQPNPFATESVFEEWERGRTAFECEGDLLTVDVYEPDSDGGEAFIRDVRYTRVAG